jgi:hypothetical protein
MGTRFQGTGRLPAWVEEGIASRYDDPDRVQIRRDILRWYAQTGNWPSLRDALVARRLPEFDRASYSIAESLTAFLLTRGEKCRFLEFAQNALQVGWDSALSTSYEISDVDELQRLWEQWAARAYLDGSEPSAADCIPGDET